MSSYLTNKKFEELYSLVQNSLDYNDFINAIKNLQNAISKNPKNDKYWQLMTKTCVKLSKFDQAESFGLTAISLNAQNPNSWASLAEAYIGNKKIKEAEYACKKATEIDENNIDVLTANIDLWICKEDFDQALKLCEKILNFDNNNISGNWGASYCYFKLEQYEKMYPYLEKLKESNKPLKFFNTMLAKYAHKVELDILKAIEKYKLEDNFAESSLASNGAIALLLASIGDIEKSNEYSLKQLSITPNDKVVFDNLMMHLHYDPSVEYKELIKYALKYQDSIYPEYSNNDFSYEDFPKINFYAKKQTLKVGFVSGDFKKHVFYNWLKSLFPSLRMNNIEIYCYCNNEPDEATSILKQEVSQWRDILNLSDNESYQLIQEDQIDILIDLSGHTAMNRLGIFARKPAPLQITWLGQSSPIGIKNIDYTISDIFFNQPQDSKYCIQEIYQLPNYYACFTPPEIELEITKLPCKTNNFITFGCFNNLLKINSTVINTWIEILHKVPNSRLNLKSKLFEDINFTKSFRNKFEERDISSKRLILDHHDINKFDYLKSYNSIDIALDPFPFGGGTTSHDLLWMGVPLITLYGSRMSSRSSGSLLKSMGLEELISYDIEEYIKKAVELAHNVEQINYYRENLRDIYLSSPCCNQVQFAKDLVEAFHCMWNQTKVRYSIKQKGCR
jgi:predicted O-linked N-acetylglucosamine transferase (SPINDLY family)